MYQILEEEDNVQFMTMIDASLNKTALDDNNETTLNESIQSATNNSDVITEDEKRKLEEDELIKTETRTGYVNIDGSEREKSKNETILSDIVKERINTYYEKVNVKGEQEIEKDTKRKDNENDTEDKITIDDIIVAQTPKTAENLQVPSATKAKEAIKILPKVIQDFLNSDWKSKPKCEPQYMLERIRNEKKYPDHPDVHKYQLLLTPAPSFLQRISLAGEFLNKKQLEM